MNSRTILILVGVAVVALIVIALVFYALSNAKKKKRLLENLDKIKREKKAQLDNEVTLQTSSTGENVSKDEPFGKIEEPPIEDTPEDYEEEPEPQDPFPRAYPRMPDRSFANSSFNPEFDRDEEFEKFLDEHGYSRKIFDKTLLEKIREMPPELKAIVLGNIFDRFNDDK